MLTQILLDFVINVTAGVVGILIVLWLEGHKRPGLTITIEKPPYRLEDDHGVREPGTWLRVHVHNKNVPRSLMRPYDGETAHACRARIEFLHLDGHRVYAAAMTGRWSGTEEPVLIPVGRTDDGQTLVTLSHVPQTVDIQPGTSELLDVVYRTEGEDVCWGWNNDSYLHSRKNPDWKLEKGRYITRVTVKTGGREFTDAFFVVNDVPYQHFRLEPLDAEAKRDLK